MTYLAIDPGISTGWALLNAAGTLVACARGQDFPTCKHAVIELPQVYRAGVSRTNPKDLITLAVRVGQYKERLEVRGATVGLVQPASWKGQVPKAIHHPRVFNSLAADEKRIASQALKNITENQAEDVWDAIGLAKEALRGGRFDR